MRLLNISISGYRALADVQVNLQPMTVLIGPNGAGKTSFLEAIHFLKEVASRRMIRDVVGERGGVTSLLTRSTDVSTALSFRITAKSDESPDDPPTVYSFRLEPERFDVRIASEECIWLADDGIAHATRVRDDDLFIQDRGHISGFPNRDNLLAPQLRYMQQVTIDASPLEVLFNAVESTKLYNALDTQPNTPIRRPQTLVPTNDPGKNGETLFSFLYNLNDFNGRQQYRERIEEVIRLAFPGFVRFEFYPVGGGQITLRWRQEGLSEPFYPHELSAGSLRFLWLVSLLLNPDPPALLLLDEPETSLHPELIQLLASLMRDASVRTQLIVATQSSELLRWLEPSDLVIADKEDGLVRLTSGTDLDLDRWLRDFTLNELWRMGVVGGRS